MMFVSKSIAVESLAPRQDLGLEDLHEGRGPGGPCAEELLNVAAREEGAVGLFVGEWRGNQAWRAR